MVGHEATEWKELIMKAMHKAIAALAATAAALTLAVAPASAAGRGGWGGPWAGSNGAGMGRMGGWGGAGNGTMTCLDGVASGTLTATEKASLAAMAGEEKLAQDVYAALAKRFPTLPQFARISAAETQHLTALRALLARYGIADPTAGLAAGVFANADRQTQYTSLLASATDTASALKVGVTIEKLDIADLANLLKTVTAPDAKQVLTMLDRASDQHLAAFGG